MPSDDQRIVFRTAVPLNLDPDSCPPTLTPSCVCLRKDNERLYAVQEVSTDHYIACLLAPWVTEDVIQCTGTEPQDFLTHLLRYRSGEDHEKALPRPSSSDARAMQQLRSTRKPTNKRGARARLSILPSAQPPVPVIITTLAATAQPSEATEASQTVPEQDKAAGLVEDTTLPVKQIDSAVVLDTLRLQYLDTLYKSKTSLAYFAKGPLTRARTQLQNFGQDALLDFYRQSIMSMKKLDIKYKDAIAQVVNVLPAQDSHSNIAPLPQPSSKPKKARKRKLGKDGLYADEQGVIASWWHGRALQDVSRPTTESGGLDFKKLVNDLRNRETEMQVLLVLEALALESTKSNKMAADTAHPEVKEEPLDGIDEILKSIPEARKPQSRRSLNSDLETLLDRLCIWHTVSSDVAAFAAGGDQHTEEDGKKPSKDRLKDFCVDVVIPFYSSRVPEQCRMICQKLGTPQISPIRPRKAPTTMLHPTNKMPGAARQAPGRPVQKRTLERVLSEDHGSRHSSPPVLSRSFSATSVPTMKRESTEPVARPESRGGLQKSRSLSNREIDLISDANRQDVKRRKLDKVAERKREIDAAIAALRKPNRSLVATEVVEELERHRAGAAKSTKRHPLAVQVNATPKKPKLGHATPFNKMPPPVTRIESTPRRPRSSGPSSALPVIPTGAAEAMTPHSGTTHENFTSSLIKDVEVRSTPLRMEKSHRKVLFTPLERADVTPDAVFRDAPLIPAEAGLAMDRVMAGGDEMSIYDTLGWNDD